MMGIIRQLDQELINKIAAGEVIDRPSSCIKELIENSLDSGASQIIVEVEDGGKSYIKVSDNGCGMSHDDIKICTRKHATSKIKNVNDLFRIASLGFRGEALSSMAAVARTEISSKSKNELTGMKVVFEGERIIEEKEIGCPEGTVVELYDLFGSIPVRKNYLKDSQTEFRHITDIIQRYALANQNVNFKLIHNKMIIFSAPASEDPLGKIVSIFGKSFARELISINTDDSEVKISGFIGKPNINRSDRNSMIVFVNGRAVKNKILYDAIFNSYDTLLNTQRFPVCVINFTIPIENIDVNVHPNKIIIKIENEDHVASIISKRIRENLLSHNLVPNADIGIIEKQKTFEAFNKEFAEPNIIDRSLPQTDINKIIHRLNLTPKDENKYRPIDNVQTNQNELVIEHRERVEIPEHLLRESPKIDLSIRILGVIHKTYILVENYNGLRIIDQHAAEERILYEKFKRRFKDKEIVKQSLLQPLHEELSPVEMQAAKEFKDKLEDLGFLFDDFGGNTLLIRTLPSILGKQQSLDLFKKTLESFQREGISENPVAQISDLFIKTMGCKSAIKAGDVINERQVKRLLEELEICEQPYTCPHGRPSIIEITVKDFQKLFNRERGYESNA